MHGYDPGLMEMERQRRELVEDDLGKVVNELGEPFDAMGAQLKALGLGLPETPPYVQDTASWVQHRYDLHDPVVAYAKQASLDARMGLPESYIDPWEPDGVVWFGEEYDRAYLEPAYGPVDMTDLARMSSMPPALVSETLERALQQAMQFVPYDTGEYRLSMYDSPEETETPLYGGFAHDDNLYNRADTPYIGQDPSDSYDHAA